MRDVALELLDVATLSASTIDGHLLVDAIDELSRT